MNEQDHDLRGASRSIREPGAAPRTLRPEPPVPSRAAAPGSGARGPRPAADPAARAARGKPDPNPLRLMLGFAGLASASAVTAALLPSITPAQAAEPVAVAVAEVAAPTPPVVHMTRYVVLEPGQTAPPQATVKAQPTPTPIIKVKVVTQTRQSGKP